MRIGIDMDDTICDSIEAMLPHICREYNLNYEEEKKKGYSYYSYLNLKGFNDFAKREFPNILFNAKLKNGADICKRENIDVFIDDSIKNCVSVGEYGIRVFIYDNTYNKNEDRFDRVYNWKEIYDKIKNQH